MPVYEYRCPGGHLVERLMSMRGRHPTFVKCRCGSRAHRVFSSTVSRGALAFEAHYNPCLDAVVTSERQMRDVELKLRDDTGIEAVPYEKVAKRSDDWKEKGARSYSTQPVGSEYWDREFEGEDGEAQEVTA